MDLVTGSGPGTRYRARPAFWEFGEGWLALEPGPETKDRALEVDPSEGSKVAFPGSSIARGSRERDRWVAKKQPKPSPVLRLNGARLVDRLR